MTQTPEPKQPTGDFYAPLNRYKQPGDSQPIFKGLITKPGDDAKLPIALWGIKYETTDKTTGEVIQRKGYSGGINGIATNLPAEEQIEALLSAPEGKEAQVANLTLRPGQIVLFENTFKDEEPGKKRPDQWGWVNPTDGTPPFRVSVWTKSFADSNTPYLSGATQYPLPGKSEHEQQDAAAQIEQLVAEGKVAKGMPKGKARSEGRA